MYFPKSSEYMNQFENLASRVNMIVAIYNYSTNANYSQGKFKIYKFTNPVDYVTGKENKWWNYVKWSIKAFKS